MKQLLENFCGKILDLAWLKFDVGPDVVVIYILAFFLKIINFTTVPNLILPLILNQLSNLQGVRDPTKNQVAPLTF